MAAAKPKLPSPPDLSTRLTLTVPEAAAVLGISERSLRARLPELPCVRFGTRRLLPVAALRRWIEEHSEIEDQRLAILAERTLRDLDL